MMKPVLLPAPVMKAEREADPLEEKSLTYEVVFQSEKGFVKVIKETIALPDATEGVRYSLPHPGACGIVCFDTDGTIVLERQWRHPCRQSFWEIPAGKLDPEEGPLACAKRELYEECGIEAQSWHSLGEVHNAIGYSNEVIHLFVAEGLTYGPKHLDPGEFLEVYRVELDEARRMCEDGRITDCKTMVAIMRLGMFLERRAREAQGERQGESQTQDV